MYNNLIMKSIFFLFLGITIFLCSCLAPKIYEVGIVTDNVSLMLYFRDGLFGYINSDTLEIVIPAQYRYADSFIGNFAIVEKPNGKLSIINKQNVEVLTRFDSGYLFETEDSKTVFALTETYSARWFNFSRGSMNDGSPAIPLPSFSFGPTRSTRRLYNLNTGKHVLHDNRMIPSQILFIDNYIIILAEVNNTHDVRNRNQEIFTTEGIVYEIKSDGTILESNISPDTLIEQIAMERHLPYRENDFHFNRELNFDALFWYTDTLDINRLLKNIPDNLTIKTESNGGGRFKGNNPVYYIEPINRNVNYPLRATTLYSISMVPNDGSREEHIGLYNSISNEWVIPPTMGDRIIPRDTEGWFNVSGYSVYGFYNIYNNKLSNNPLFSRFNYAHRVSAKRLRIHSIVYFGYE